MRPIPCGRASLPACLVALAAGCSGDVGDDRSASAARRPPSKAEVDFETDAAGHAPTGFIFARTGSGAIGEWQVIHNQNEDDTPSGTKVLAQLSDDRTGRRYPVAIREGFAAKNVRVSVRIKPISGRKDQAGGIVLRYQDEGNYYVVRTNALENNVQFHLTKDGVRKHEFAARPVRIERGEWHTLVVELVGDTFKVYVDGRFLGPEVVEGTIAAAGLAGLWTKADSVTWFDDLAIESLDRE